MWDIEVIRLLYYLPKGNEKRKIWITIRNIKIDNVYRVLIFCWLIYSDLLNTFLYYLPMERMKLEMENKKLKEYNEKLAKWNYDELQRLGLENYELREENKNLNIKVASLEWEIKWLNSTIDKLHKEIEEQEAEWGWLFDEIDYRKRECKNLKERIDVLYEFIERNDKLVDEVIDEEDLDKLNRYIYIDDDLVDRTLESEE